MPFKFKKTNILYDVQTPESGWIILGFDEDGQLVTKDENGNYEKVVKDETYGIYLRLETDYMTIGNRVADSNEGLYSYTQGDYNISSGYATTSIGKYATSINMFSYAYGENVNSTGVGSYIYGRGSSTSTPLESAGKYSFVHSYLSVNSTMGAYGDYSVSLGGVNNNIGTGSDYSTIIGGTNNSISNNIRYTTIINGKDIVADKEYTLYTMNIKCVSGITTDSLFVSSIITNNTIKNTEFIDDTNLSIGFNNLLPLDNIPINNNTIIGGNNVNNLTLGNNNIILGFDIANVASNDITTITEINNNIYIGSNIKPYTNRTNNEIIIGNNVFGKGDNTILIGNDTTIATYFNGDIYQDNASIHPSDERLKTPIRDFSEKEKQVAKEIINEIGVYKFLNSVDENGILARNHIGLTVQKVINIMEKYELNPFEYSFICKDNNTNDKYNSYLKDGIIYSFRYTELTLFIMKGMVNVINDFDKRLTILEEKSGN